MTENIFNMRSRAVSWRDELILTPTKTPKTLLANALTALRRAPNWVGVLAYDEFAHRAMAMQPPPWIATNGEWKPRPWEDADDTLTAEWLQREDICISDKVTATAVQAAARDHSFHPIKDYLDGLKWDGVARVAGFASSYLGAEDTPYHRAVGQCFLIGGVARIMRPGCKLDTIPILEGPQGEGKSTSIEILFAPWFTDDIAELGTKDASMQVRAARGIEIGELSSMTRGEIEKVKAFISRKVDRFRPSYGRHVIEVPRQSVFAGSTNDSEYMKDATGARRYLPILCGKFHLKSLKRDRDQLWAEAAALYRKGEPWWITNASLLEAVKEEQAGRYMEDAWAELIEDYVRGKADTSVPEVLSFLMSDQAKWGQREQTRVGRCLVHLGWHKQRPRTAGGRQWRHYPPQRS
jgi:predicted P-loop ATPase